MLFLWGYHAIACKLRQSNNPQILTLLTHANKHNILLQTRLLSHQQTTP